MATPNVLVTAGYGLNCDHETAYAFELAGARARRVHINAMIDGSETLEDYQVMAFVGGFGWGDDHGAGVVQAVKMQTHLGDDIRAFVEKGNLVIGICNGFQALVNLGLLPAFDPGRSARRVALTYNDCGSFRDDWVGLCVNPESPCVFTRGINYLELPIRHGEGKFYTDSETLQRLRENHQIVFQYAMPDGAPADGRFPDNPNGSLDDIAGICDPTGRVLGLMPHPEAYNQWTNHPHWPREKEKARRAGIPFGIGDTPGIQLFRKAVDFLRES